MLPQVSVGRYDCAVRVLDLLRMPDEARRFAAAAHEHVRGRFLLPRLAAGVIGGDRWGARRVEGAVLPGSALRRPSSGRRTRFLGAAPRRVNSGS